MSEYIAVIFVTYESMYLGFIYLFQNLFKISTVHSQTYLPNPQINLIILTIYFQLKLNFKATVYEFN